MMIETKNKICIASLKGSGVEDEVEIIALAAEAEKFLLSHKWCEQINNGWLEEGWGDMLAVFLFEIVTNDSNVDNQVWIVSGDLPSAYIDIGSAKTGIEAIKCYVDLMEDWIRCVEKGKSVEECYPIGVPPKLEFAKMLSVRMKIIKEEILGLK